MKNRLILLIVCIGILGVFSIKIIGLSSIKYSFIRSNLAKIYVKYIRDGKNFDSDHVITHLDNGMPIIVNKNDQCVCWFIRLTGHWDSNEKKILEKIIKKEFNIVEVGANFGVHTLMMAKLVGEKGKIYAFEANPTVSKYLKESIKLNNLSNNITLFEKAAGDVPGESFLEYGIQNIGGGHIVTSKSPSTIKTEIVRLDDVVEEQRIDLLKIDAEGYEFNILKGAKELITRNIDHIILMMEFVPSHLKNQKTDPELVIQFLKSHKFSLWRVGKKNLGEPLLVPISYDELTNLIEADIVASRIPIY